MIPAPFDWHRPRDLGEALALLRDLGDEAKLIAGGHSLLPMMKLRLATPAHLIDVSRLPALSGVRIDGDHLVIGAACTHWQVQSSALVRQRLPFLAEVAGGIADAQVRNRGTIGGSLAHADPAADYPAALLASGATLSCTGPRGQRQVAIDDWFTGVMSTALDTDEIVTEVRVPLPPRGFAASYVKFRHPASRFAMPGVAAALTTDARGRCVAVRIGVTGIGALPARALRAEAALQGQPDTVAAIDGSADLADDGLDVDAGFQISADDKRHLLREACRRALRGAFDAARRAA